MKKKIIVAMSGGVDSSTTAALLLEQGYEVEGLTMNLWDGHHQGADKQISPVTDVIGAARSVAAELGIPFHPFDLKSEFRNQVIDPFCDAYLGGTTPNPCIVCNQFLKFGRLLDLAKGLGGDYLATGHYVRVATDGGHLRVRKGADLHKDQSYFLYTLGAQQLSHCLFPLGDMTKSQVRAEAKRLGLVVAEKSESQDICFIPDGNYAAFLNKERDVRSLDGDIVHISGQVLGQHQGAHRYTIGQRKGLGIGWSEPLYVVRIDAGEKKVVVAEREYLSHQELNLYGCHWNRRDDVTAFDCTGRIRYRHGDSDASVEILPGNKARVVFKEPQFSVTPGQAAVFYDDDCVIGGGWIQ